MKKEKKRQFTSLSVLQRSLKHARSLATGAYVFFVTFSRISNDTLNSYIAVDNGFPVMSDVIEAIIRLLLSTADVTLPVMLFCWGRR
jgi:hypothetical protein